MKLVVMCAVAAVVGIGAGTVLSPARRAVPPVADHPATATDSNQVPVEEATPSGDSLTTTSGDSVDPALPPGAATPLSATERATMVEHVAALKAVDAASMIALLPDSDAVAVLKALPITRASEILDAMGRDQAARLSRELLLAGVTP